MAIVAAVIAFRPVPSPAAEPARRPVRAAVLSPRRVPALLSAAIAQGRLARSLDAFLGDPALGGGRQDSCLVVDHAGERLYAQRATRALTPASTLKLLTGAAALRRLGADTRFETTVVAERAPNDGVVEGDVWLVGGGDPLLATADYEQKFDKAPRLTTDIARIAERVRAAGVREIRGRVRGDEGRYDTQRYLPTWKPGFTTGGNMGALSALAVNDGYAGTTPFSGASPAPATQAASLFTAALLRNGVDVAAPAGEGRAPAGATKLAGVESHPLRTIVGEMLTHSDNETAELLTKELGHRFGGSGTTNAGVAVTRKTLADAGFDVSAVAASDGSGLDDGDKLPCAVLAAVLASTDGEEIARAGLSVAGGAGTLFDQFEANAAAGRLRAKTGALEGVVALAGVIDATVPGAKPLSFSFIANSLPAPSHDRGERAQERLGAALAAYPDAPAADALAP